MDQLKRLWEGLSLQQKLMLGVVVLAALAGIYYVLEASRENGFRPLYTGLDADEAGKITAQLRTQNVDYRLDDDGKTIKVPEPRLAEVRLSLAAEGLPQKGRIGFELFDKPNLGVTEFQEQVNYHRALEGELERSVMSLAAVESAKVHLTQAKNSVFTDLRQPAKASVILKLKPRSEITPGQAQAISHLVASAVDGLMPGSVSILDMRANLLSRPRNAPSADGAVPDDAQLDYRRRVEQDLEAKVQATLEPLVGADHFRANLSADVDFASGEQTEESFDPSRSVMASQQRTEDTSGATQAAGVPGTQSTLPRPTSSPSQNGRSTARRTENITFLSTRTVKRMKLPQGSIRRISLSVLVDQKVRWDGKGAAAKRVLEPPDAAQIQKIRDVVSAAIGIQPTRGDTLIVETMPFDATLRTEPPAAPGAAPAPAAPPAVFGVTIPAWVPPPARDFKVLGLIAAIALILLLAIIAIPIILMKRKKAAKTAAASAATAAATLPPGSQVPPGVAGATSLPPATQFVMQQMTAPPMGPDGTPLTAEQVMADQENRKRHLELEAMRALKLPDVATKKGEVLTKHVIEEARKDPAAVATVLRNWLQEDAFTR